jgi:hypothetical protein
MIESGATEYQFDDASFWHTLLPEVEHAVLPPQSDRPNPRLVGSLLFVSTFAPAYIYAIDSSTGHVAWYRKLHGLGGNAVEVRDGVLFAKTTQMLYALDPSSGRTIWEFRPYAAESEMLYSEPLVESGKVFIGDRQGRLHCLNAKSGLRIWSIQTSEAPGSDVNATATLFAGAVITATNSGAALAYGIEDGRHLWRAQLDGPCTNQLFVSRERIVAAAESLYFLEPTTGLVEIQLHWPGLAVGFAAGSASEVALFRRRSHETDKAAQEGSKDGLEERVLVTRCEGTPQEIPCSTGAIALRHSLDTDLLYVSGYHGVDILEPTKGQWLYALRSADGWTSVVEVAGDRIYTLSANGSVRALRHP